MNALTDANDDDRIPTDPGDTRSPTDDARLGAGITQSSANIHLAPSMNGTVEPQELVHRLIGMPVGVTLYNTEGYAICLGADVSFVVYVYPGSDTSDAHGSDTPLADVEQHLGFREVHDDLVACRFATVGVSSQPFEKQKEAIEVNHLPQQLASDESLRLAALLTLPTFWLRGKRRYKRLTLVIVHGVIVHVFYPVVVPVRHAAEVAAWLRQARI